MFVTNMKTNIFHSGGVFFRPTKHVKVDHVFNGEHTSKKDRKNSSCVKKENHVGEKRKLVTLANAPIFL